MRVFALAICACLALAPAARAEVQFSIRGGRVTIVAKDATVRQILAEWARVGKTKIVNGERIPGGPITLELKDVPEAEALDILLRTLSGYIAAPRAALTSADASVYDSIAVMPTVAAAAARTAGPSNSPAPFSPPPVFNQNDDDQDSAAAPGPVRPGGVPSQPGRPPIFSTFPTPQTGNGSGNAPRPMLPVVRPGQPQQNNNPEPLQQPVQAPPAAGPSTSPGGSAGTSAPGMLPPAASQPGQIVQPQRPPGE